MLVLSKVMFEIGLLVSLKRTCPLDAIDPNVSIRMFLTFARDERGSGSDVYVDSSDIMLEADKTPFLAFPISCERQAAKRSTRSANHVSNRCEIVAIISISSTTRHPQADFTAVLATAASIESRIEMNSERVLRHDKINSIGEDDDDDEIILAATVAGDDFQKISNGLQREIIDEHCDTDSST